MGDCDVPLFCIYIKQQNMIIGISAKAHSGKDLVGDYLVDKYGFKKVKFADKLKEIVALCLSVPRDMLENQEYKETILPSEWWVFEIPNLEGGVTVYPYEKYKDEYHEKFLVKVTPRWLLQKIGTECFRNIISPMFWVNALFASFVDGVDYVITDVRFPNEADKVKESGGTLIRLNRDGCLLSSHKSEIALDSYDFDSVVDNNGTKEELYAKIDEILYGIRGDNRKG